MTPKQARLVLAVGVFLGCVIGGAIGAKTVDRSPKSEVHRLNITPLGDVLLTDGATASLVADRLVQLKPNIDRSLGWQISISTARWCRNYGVKWQVLIALIHWETRGSWDPSETGRAGERGLTQVMAKWGGTSDVDGSIRVGASYLAGCLAGEHGDYRSALAAYNAGPSKRGGWGYADQVLRIEEGLR